MYKLTASGSAVIRIADNAGIPADPHNRDYAEYLAWQALGNTPAPYVEPNEQRLSRIDAELALTDLRAARAIRELLLDQLNVKNLTGPQRAAARDRLKREDDAADLLRSRR